MGAIAIGLCFNGYHFGVFDHAIHVPFLKRMLDPELFPQDPFLDFSGNKTTYFWILLLPFFRAVGVPWGFFVLFCVAWVAYVAMVYRLAQTLFHDSTVSTISVVVLLTPKLAFGFMPTIDGIMVPRFVVFPLLLLSICLFLERRFFSAFAVVACSFNLHPISALFVLGMFSAWVLLSPRRPNWSAMVGLYGMAALLVAPTFLWKTGSGGGLDWSVHAQWARFMREVIPVFYNFSRLDFPVVTIGQVSGAVVVALFFVSRRRVREASEEKREMVLAFALGTLAICSLAVVAAEVRPWTLVMQLQPIRAARFLTIFAYIYCAAWVWRMHVERRMARWWLGGTLLAMWSSAFPLGLVPTLSASAGLGRRNRLSLALWLFGVSLCLANLPLSWAARAWRPGIVLSSPRNSLAQVQGWIRDNTLKRDRFVAPLPEYAVDQPDFRAIAERFFVVTLADGQEVAFNVGAESAVTGRMQDCLKGGFEKVLEGKVDFLSRGAWYRDAYASNREEDFARLARKYSLTYVVTEKPHRLAWEKVFENRDYCVYRVERGNAGGLR